MHQLIVNLLDNVYEDIQAVMVMDKVNMTDATNRAIAVGTYIIRQKALGKEILLRSKDGSVEQVHIM